MKLGRSKVQFCLRGHDTFIVGRYQSSGCCKVCAKELALKWQKSNLEKNRETDSRWYKNNLDKVRESVFNWRKANSKKVIAYAIKCNLKRLKRVPTYGQDGILEFYMNRPKGYEVDHIIPLQGKTVSGLHVIWNLQYLTPTQNRKKNNKYLGSL
jgi:5-methylcytosine-specific restriction endonuclease McrA